MEENDDDKFRRFNRERLNKLFNNLGKNKPESNEEFTRKFFTPENNGDEPTLEDFMNIIINGFNGNKDVTTDEWTDENGSYYSVSYSFIPEDDYEHYFQETEQPSDEYVISILEEKLARAVEEEDFESAASFRDTIKSLRKGQESKG